MKRASAVSIILLLSLSVLSYSCCRKTSPAAVIPPGNKAEIPLWTAVDHKTIEVKGPQIPLPSQFGTFRLNTVSMKDLLTRANLSKGDLSGKGVVIPLPLPDGTMSRFAVIESSTVDAALLMKYPHLRTYSGKGIDDPTATAKLDFMLTGFHAYLFTQKGSVIIEPYSTPDTLHYFSYYKQFSSEIKQPFENQTDTLK